MTIDEKIEEIKKCNVKPIEQQQRSFFLSSGKIDK